MKLLFDFFPILLFFVSYKVFDIFVATAVAIIASIVQVGLYRFKNKRYETMHLVTMGLIILFGGATLLLQDELFIKWKPSIVNWLFGLAFLASQFVGDQPLAKRMMGSAIDMPAYIWTRLNLAWGLFFIALGLINLYVIYHFDTDTWVNFKLFGMLGLTIGFVIVQSVYIGRYIKDDQSVTAQDDKD
jgi:intracellular septation protein